MRISFSATKVPPFCNPRLAAAIDFFYDEYVSDHLRDVGVFFTQQRFHESLGKSEDLDAISLAHRPTETILSFQ